MNTPDSYKLFAGLNTYEAIQIYKRNLPHWRQDGGTYFVTFRLADSLPKHVMESWMEERERWYAAWDLVGEMSQEEYKKRYLAIPQTIRMKFERDQMSKPLQELDKCHGSCIFRNQEYADLLKSALLFFDRDRLQCGDFVIMPNHVHWIVMPLQGYLLEQLVKGIKQYVSREVGLLAVDLRGAIWQDETYDRCIRDREELVRIRTYIEKNPAAAKLSAGKYIHYKARWLDE